MTDPFEKWLEFYLKSGRKLQWPSEPLVRIVSNPKYYGFSRPLEGQRVLDLGCGSGNNLLFFCSRGCKAYGLEIDQTVAESVQSSLRRAGFSAEVKVGTNRSIPYSSEFFDILVSWNVLHYESTSEDILDALREYRRVLKRDGWLFVSTTGPRNSIIEGAQRVGKHRYRITRSDDFRCGQIFFYFDDEDAIYDFFSQFFEKVEVGRYTEQHGEWILDYFIIVACGKTE